MAVMLADLVDGTNAGMIQRRGGARLPPEALQCLWFVRSFVGKELKRNETPERGVLGAIDDTHPAAAQNIKDPVVGNSLPDHSALHALAGLGFGCIRWHSAKPS